MTSALLDSIREATRSRNRFVRRRLNEQAFVVFVSEPVPAGGSVNLHLANPTTGTKIDVHRFVVTSQFRGQYTIYDQFSSSPSGGTALEIDNLRMDLNGDADSGQMESAKNVTFTASGSHFAQALPSGGAGGGTTGGEVSATEPIIDPSREIVVELTNDSSNERPGSVGLVFSEFVNNDD